MQGGAKEIRDPLIGTCIDDRYRVQGVLGRGGMGVVYDGIHEQLGRPVAIKVLGASIAGDRTAVERFLREARTASRLTHGNIVDVSDLGTLPDGRPYLVMAKMYGTDLCSLLQKNGPQTPRRTAELLKGAASALDLIHAKGFVHRDVKPENLMHVVREDGSEAVLLLDFGIVGLVQSQQNARLTADGSVFGTPAYLSPEVIGGAPAERRADVYALATVAFELITGRPPFQAANALRILPMKLMQDAPRMGDVCHFVFPEALEAAIARGLAREPVDRFESAGSFVSALEAAAGQRAAPLRSDLSPTPALGLDPASRERLRTASTAELEMPIGYSPPPPGPHPPASTFADTELVPLPQSELLSSNSPRNGSQAGKQNRQQLPAPGRGQSLAGSADSRRMTMAGEIDPAEMMLDEPDVLVSMPPSVMPPSAADVRAARSLPLSTVARPTAVSVVPHPRSLTASFVAAVPMHNVGKLLGMAVIVGVLGVLALYWGLSASKPTPVLTPLPDATATPAAPPSAPTESQQPTAAAPTEPPTLPRLADDEPTARTPQPSAAKQAKSAAQPAAAKPAATPAAAPAKPAAALPVAPVAKQVPGHSAATLIRGAQDELLAGNYASAAKLYQLATRVAPDDEAAWRGLGLANEKRGLNAEAVRALKRALQLVPAGPKADALRARIEKLSAAK